MGISFLMAVLQVDSEEIYYAMKTLRKHDVIEGNQTAHVKAERDILAEANSDWIVKLYYSLQDQHNLYFVMEYIPGGDMMALLIKKEIFSEALAQSVYIIRFRSHSITKIGPISQILHRRACLRH